MIIYFSCKRFLVLVGCKTTAKDRQPVRGKFGNLLHSVVEEPARRFSPRDVLFLPPPHFVPRRDVSFPLLLRFVSPSPAFRFPHRDVPFPISASQFSHIGVSFSVLPPPPLPSGLRGVSFPHGDYHFPQMAPSWRRGSLSGLSVNRRIPSRRSSEHSAAFVCSVMFSVQHSM